MSNYGLEKGNGIAIAHTHKNVPIHINAGGVYFVNVKNLKNNYIRNANLVTKDFDKAIAFIDQWLDGNNEVWANVWIVRKYLPFMRKKKIKVKLGDTVTYSDGSDHTKLDQKFVLPEKFEVTQAYSNIMGLYNKYKAANNKIKEAETEKANIVEMYNKEIDKIKDMYFDVTTIDLEA